MGLREDDGFNFDHDLEVPVDLWFSNCGPQTNSITRNAQKCTFSDSLNQEL